MTSRSFVNDFQTFEEDTTYTITRGKLSDYYLKNKYDPGELSPKSFPQKVRFEFGDNAIISTHETDDGTTFRYVYEGDFTYSKKSALKNIKFEEGYAVFHNPKNREEYGWRTQPKKRISDRVESFIDFETLTIKLFDKKIITDEYDIYKDKYEIIKGKGNDNITKGKHALYFKDGWQKIAFEENLIKSRNGGLSNNNNFKGSTTSTDTDDVAPPTEYILSSPNKFSKKSVTKISNFDIAFDSIKIDTASFGIDDITNPATAARANGKKALKNLAMQNFDFLYNEKAGGLYFNENGPERGFGDGGIIAILKGAPDLTSSNFNFM
tara:strand:+ start:509 stop:1477 length:969 start_codon:yes stop_codon:yes gene_type:complete